LKKGGTTIFVNTDKKEHGWEEERREKKEIRRESFSFLFPHSASYPCSTLSVGNPSFEDSGPALRTSLNIY